MIIPGKARPRIWLLCVMPLAAGLLLRLWFVLHAGRVSGDALLYGDIAHNWLYHWVYGFTRTVDGISGVARPTLIRLPGYPLFLMTCFRIFGDQQYFAVMLVQIAVDLATCAVIAALTRRLFGARAGLAALWMAALCPFTAIYVSAPLTETLTLACIATAFYSLHRWQAAGAGFNRWIAAIAASLAYAILLRPEQGMLAAAVGPAMLYLALTNKTVISTGAQRSGETPVFSFSPYGHRIGESFKRTLPVLIMAILTILPLVPWTIRNQRTFHQFQPLAPRFATDPGEPIPYGFQRWYRTWGVDFASTEQVYWNYDGAPIDIADLPDRAFDSTAQYDRTAQLLSQYNVTSSASRAFDRSFDALATERIHNDPLRYYLAMPVARVMNMAFRPRTELLNVPLEWWKFRNWPGQTLFAAAYGLLNLAYVALAAIGFRNWKTRGALGWSMLATIVLRCLLLLTLDNSETRYTLEFFPVLIIFAASLWRASPEAS